MLKLWTLEVYCMYTPVSLSRRRESYSGLPVVFVKYLNNLLNRHILYGFDDKTVFGWYIEKKFQH